MITNELVLNILKEKLNEVVLEHTDDYPGSRKVFEWEIDYQSKNYFLAF